jgi:hypothetical protein
MTIGSPVAAGCDGHHGIADFQPRPLFFRYFSSTHRTALSRFRGTFHSFDPVGFCYFRVSEPLDRPCVGSVLARDQAIELQYPGSQRPQLGAESANTCARHVGQPFVTGIGDDTEQLFNTIASDQCDPHRSRRHCEPVHRRHPIRLFVMAVAAAHAPACHIGPCQSRSTNEEQAL